MDGAIPGQVGLDCVREVAEEVRLSKPSAMVRFCSYLLVPALASPNDRL